MRRTQARTNHLGYDAGSSRKIPGGLISVTSSAPTKCLEAVTLSALPFAAVRFPFLVPVFDTVKAALKVSTSTVELPSQLHAKSGPWSSDLHQLAATLEAKSKCQLRATMAAFVRQTAAVIATSIAVEAQEKAQAPTFQIQVKVDGATVMLDAGSAWTAADVKAALHTKTGRASGGYYLVAGGGKPLNDGAATTLAALGVGPGDQLELRGRLRGGMPNQADLRAAFALYDTNGDGQLSPDELKAIMCKQVPGGTARTEAEVDELVRQFDADGDGMLSMEEISKAWAGLDLKTSYWDQVGAGKPNASALKRALADTVLVDAAWLAQLADAGGVLPRCQDLPEGARVTLEEMEMWKDDYTVGVLVISYPWWAPPHSTLA